MNYAKAKTYAQLAADESGMCQVILFNGVEYSFINAKRHKGEFFELIAPALVSEVGETISIEKPTKKVKKDAIQEA